MKTRNIESIRKAIKQGSDILGIYYTEDILNIVSMFIFKNFSLSASELYTLIEKYAVSYSPDRQERLSGAFIAKIINSNKKVVIK